VDLLLQRAAEHVQSHPTDPQRFQKAETDIGAARQYARAFRLDPMRVEQKAQWLQQAAAAADAEGSWTWVALPATPFFAAWRSSPTWPC
jgi:hypothetical protein